MAFSQEFRPRFSRRGDLLACGGTDGAVRICRISPVPEVATVDQSTELAVLRGHDDWVFDVAFSADGNWLASGSYNGTSRLRDTTTWQQAAVHNQRNAVCGMEISVDGTHLAYACANNSIRLYDFATRQFIWRATRPQCLRATCRIQSRWHPPGLRLQRCNGSNLRRPVTPGARIARQNTRDSQPRRANAVTSRRPRLGDWISLSHGWSVGCRHRRTASSSTVAGRRRAQHPVSRVVALLSSRGRHQSS